MTALFSAAEMSFIAANRLRLRHLAEAGNRNAARYLESFRQPERFLSTVMMGVDDRPRHGVVGRHLGADAAASAPPRRWW